MKFSNCRICYNNDLFPIIYILNSPMSNPRFDNNCDIKEDFITTIKSPRLKYYDNLVLHIPHAGISGLDSTCWSDKLSLLNEVRRWTDWYTDVIFVPEDVDSLKIHSIIATNSRFVLDMERLINDPFEKEGQGINYTSFSGVHREVDVEEKKRLMIRYTAHQEELKSLLNEHSLLIDCHSFPSELSDVDVCIGVNDDWSRPSDFVIGIVKEGFDRQGYKVRVNEPYSNSIAPVTNFIYSSLMIELNKRIYMNEDTLEITSGAKLVRNVLRQIYGILINHSELT